jgi:hypothetical protein
VFEVTDVRTSCSFILRCSSLPSTSCEVAIGLRTSVLSLSAMLMARELALRPSCRALRRGPMKLGKCSVDEHERVDDGHKSRRTAF